MAAPETLVIIHYHLLTGGVCSAIKNSLAALAKAGWLRQKSVRVLTGRKRGIEEFRRSLDSLNIRVEFKVDSRLDYSTRVWPDRDTFWIEASALATWFLDQARGSSLYWVQNPTLGKNALVTAALMTAGQRATAAESPHRFLYHIHDFAECGRLWNLMNLRRCWRGGGLEDFYPVANAFGYAVLNSADLRRLSQAGIPPERLFLLPNAVPRKRPECSTSRKAVAHALWRYARDNGYRFEPQRPWWTLPIRLIRRKNVVEALIVSALAAEGTQLLITLDASSEPERPYAEAVKNLCRQQKQPVVIGFGHELVGNVFGFDDLLVASDAVVSTSVLEGFGFAFLEGASRGRPLVGRNLSDVTSDFVEIGFPSDSLYESFWVPIDKETREQLIIGGWQFAREKGVLLGLDQARVDSFGEAVEKVFADSVVDFGFLGLRQQLDLVRHLETETFVQELKSLNPGAAEPVEFPADFNERLQQCFGLRSHATRLVHAFESLFMRDCRVNSTENISGRLLDLYFLPHYHRPLIGEW